MGTTKRQEKVFVDNGGSQARASPRFSGKKRPFYGISPKKKVSPESVIIIEDDEDTSDKISPKSIIFIDDDEEEDSNKNVAESTNLLHQVYEKALLEENGSSSSEVVEISNNQLNQVHDKVSVEENGSEKRFSPRLAGKKRPFYGPPNLLNQGREGKVCNDISGGQERIPVPAFNLIDNPPVAPMDYTYSSTVQLAEGITLPENHTGCGCIGACVDAKKCACAKLNGSDFPYVEGGRLLEAKDVVFECGPNCKCGPDCINRTSQQGLRFRLEVFRTQNKGWAVRSRNFIPSGAPVCEYTGVLARTKDLDNVCGDDFIFEIDCLETKEGLDGRESRLVAVSIPTATSTRKEKINGKKTESVRDPEFSIDGGKVGGVARFINHSCDPNLFVQGVLSSHHDIKLARVVLFAAEDIRPLQELTYDYGYALDSVIGPDGKIKVMPCYCSAEDCRKRLY